MQRRTLTSLGGDGVSLVNKWRRIMEKIIAYQRSKTHDVLLTVMREKNIWSKFEVDMDSRYVPSREVELVRHPAKGNVYEEMLDQLLKGEVDAAFLVPPFDLMAQEAGFVTLEETRFFPNIMGGTLTLTGDFTKTNPEAVQRLIKAVIYGIWFVKKHREESMSLMEKHSRYKNLEHLHYTLERQIELLES